MTNDLEDARVKQQEEQYAKKELGLLLHRLRNLPAASRANLQAVFHATYHRGNARRCDPARAPVIRPARKGCRRQGHVVAHEATGHDRVD